MKFRKRKIITTLLVAILVSTLSAVFVPKISATTNSSGLLQVSGQWIVDVNGNRIELRGAGCVYTAYGRTDWLQQYAEWIQETGCNCVRLFFEFPDPNGAWSVTSSDMWYNATLMSQIISLFSQNGIYVILCDADTYSGSSGTAILPTYSQTWINDWASLASTFEDNSDIAMYELFNEPYGPSVAPSVMEPLYISCINAIRAVGDNHIVMCWDGDFSSSSQILPNMVLDEHWGWDFGNEKATETASGQNYFTEDSASSSSTNQFIDAELYASETISSILEARSTFDCPVLLGELELYNYSMSSPDVYCDQSIIEMAEQYGISWNIWSFDGMIQGTYGSNGPTFWTDFVSQDLGGAFTSSYVSSSIPWNQTINLETLNEAYGYNSVSVNGEQAFPSFPALPFNIWNSINTTASTFWYDTWGVTHIILGSSASNIVFYGPCMLRVQDWSSGGPYYGTVAGDQYIDLSAGQTTSIAIGSYSDVVIYAWANSPTYLPLPNNSSSSPSPTPAPTATPTPTPVPTPMPTATPTPTPVSTPVPTADPTPTPTRVPTPLPTATPTPTPVPTPMPKATPTPVPLPIPTTDPTPSPAVDPTPLPTATPTPTPTPAPSADSTPALTSAPTTDPNPVSTPVPTAYPTPAPTKTPTPTPTATPTLKPIPTSTLTAVQRSSQHIPKNFGYTIGLARFNVLFYLLQLKVEIFPSFCLN